MADLEQVMERLVSDPLFRRQLEEDPASALSGYDLTRDEVTMLASGLDEAGGQSKVEQRTSKAGVAGLFAAVFEAGQAPADASSLDAGAAAGDQSRGALDHTLGGRHEHTSEESRLRVHGLGGSDTVSLDQSQSAGDSPDARRLAVRDLNDAPELGPDHLVGEIGQAGDRDSSNWTRVGTIWAGAATGEPATSPATEGEGEYVLTEVTHTAGQGAAGTDDFGPASPDEAEGEAPGGSPSREPPAGS